MPMITVPDVGPREHDDLRPRIAALAAGLAHETLGKDLGVTDVLVEADDGDADGDGGRTRNTRRAVAHPG